MSANDEGLTVVNNEAEQRYEVRQGDLLAELDYELEGNSIVYIHTGVPDEMAGHGVGNLLARTALEDARAQGRTIVPLCPFVTAYLRRHPAYQDLLAESQRARFQRGASKTEG